MTTCLRCRVMRMRVIAVSFLAFGQDTHQVREKLAAKNPDIAFWTFSENGFISLNASKDGWHYEISKVKA